MSKKLFPFIHVLFVASILIAGCSPAADESPSSRLVGHWEAAYEREGSPEAIYLGELSSDGKGKVYLSYDLVNYCERSYEIISEDEDTYTVRFYRGDSPRYAEESVEFRDDRFIRWKYLDGELIGEFTYVDSETELEDLGPLAENGNDYLTITPLTGHWVLINDADGKIDDSWNVYFGRINDDGEGVYYESGEGTPDLKWTFKIISEDGRDYDLQSKFECGGWDMSERWEVSEDGQNLKLFLGDEIYQFKYVDSNTEP
jgi:hypothetical protein